VRSDFEFKALTKRKNFFRSSYAAVAASNYLPTLRPAIEMIDKSLYSATNWGPFKRMEKPAQVVASADAIQTLYHLYQEENAQLFGLLGRTIEAWIPQSQSVAISADETPAHRPDMEMSVK
jgi:hypothetical protein